VTGTPLAIMKCPSDIHGGPTIDPNGQPGTFDKGNYGLNYGGGWPNENGNSGNRAGPNDFPDWTVTVHGQASRNRGLASPRDGVNGNVPSGVALRDILDGTSNTLLLGEILQFAGDNDDCRGCWGKAMSAIVSAYTLANPQTSGADGIATPNVPAIGNYRDCPPHCANSPTVGDRQLECGDCTNDTDGGVAARSRHEGGVFFALCDGSVRFIGENLDKALYRAIFTIRGNERLGEF
jgi:hypothetical protein